MTAPLTPEAMAALRALAERATPGPWEHQSWFHGGQGVVTESYQVAGCGANGNSANDARYIAAADPTTVLALLDEVERLREALDRIGQPKYGLQGIYEDGKEGAEEETAYWKTLVYRYEATARAALAESRQDASVGSLERAGGTEGGKAG